MYKVLFSTILFNQTETVDVAFQAVTCISRNVRKFPEISRNFRIIPVNIKFSENLVLPEHFLKFLEIFGIFVHF